MVPDPQAAIITQHKCHGNTAEGLGMRKVQRNVERPKGRIVNSAKYKEM